MVYSQVRHYGLMQGVAFGAIIAGNDTATELCGTRQATFVRRAEQWSRRETLGDLGRYTGEMGISDFLCTNYPPKKNARPAFHLDTGGRIVADDWGIGWNPTVEDLRISDPFRAAAAIDQVGFLIYTNYGFNVSADEWVELYELLG